MYYIRLLPHNKDILLAAAGIKVYLTAIMDAIPVYDIEEFLYRAVQKTLYVNTICAHLNENRNTVKPHKQAFYSCLLITKGSGTHHLDANSCVVKPGYVFLTHPGQVHDWRFSADIDGYIIFHTKDFYDLNFTYERISQFLFFGLSGTPLIVLSKTAYEKIEPIFQSIAGEYESERVMKFQKICSLLNVLYIELSEIYPPQKQLSNRNKNQYAQVQNLEDFIDKNYKSLKLPKQYAALMNLSQKHLNRIVKSSLNKTTSELISERVVLEAKRMLIHSTLSVTQIAIELGYLDNTYFFRIFKNKVGETPIGYMNNFKKD
jgi:AraC-like DNA-binding protein